MTVPVAVEEVRDGVLRLEFPTRAGPSNRVNSWALRDGDNWVLVDTGDDTEETRQLWPWVLTKILRAPVSRIVCTHYHRDHIGQADWLSAQFDAPVYISAAERERAEAVFAGAYSAPDGPLARQLMLCGWQLGEVQGVLAKRGRFARTLPAHCEDLREGDTLRIGDGRWTVALAGGHSPGAAILTEADQQLMIVGDQVLERITPHIGVPPTALQDDPLGAYLTFLDKMVRTTGSELALPGHGPPLGAVGARAAELVSYHEQCLARLLAVLDRPRNCVDLLPVLFGRDLTGFERVLGTTETHAHLNRLVETGQVRRDVAAGVLSYLAVSHV